MANLDLSDFLILKEIHRTRSITGSVEHVGLSQPSISMRLSHLRRHFGDALFVRTSEGMMPTPLLEKMLPDIDHALELLSPREGRYAEFDPATSTRRFRLSLSHVAQMVLLPQLLSMLETTAPGLCMDSLELDHQTGRLLESGEVDVAIGYASELYGGFYQQRLFTEHYACIARRDHPRVGGKLTTRQFVSESYAALDAPATGYWSLDKALEGLGIERRIKVKVSSFMGMGQAIASTDLLAIVPARLAQSLARAGQVKALKIPVPTPSYEVRQFWHERYHREPGNCWLRQTMFDAFLDMPGAA